MTQKKGNPGCPCCPCCDPCILDRIVGPVEVTDAQTTTIRSRFHPQSPYSFWLQVEIKADAKGAVPRLFVAIDTIAGTGIYVDFHFETPTPTSGTVRAYAADGTQLDADFFVDGLVSGEWHLVTICFDPDTQPDRILLTVDPPGDAHYGTAYPEQSVSYKVEPFSAGRQAGYGTSGTHSGTASFRNYTLDRLWYCGDSPHTSDCRELCEPLEDDYCYSLPLLPIRTDCHECIPCYRWNSGGYAPISESDEKKLLIGGNANFLSLTGTVVIYGGDTGLFGWSDNIKRNQIYVEFSHNAPTVWSLSVQIGSFYDEEKDLFYFFFVYLGNYQLTYTIKKVTDGGTSAIVSGPTTITPPTSHIYMGRGDGSSGLNGQTRSILYGAGAMSHPIGFLINARNCECNRGGGEPQPRHFLATVSGVAQGNPFYPAYGEPLIYYDYDRLNWTSQTLYNYRAWDLGSPFNLSCSGDCYFGEVLDLLTSTGGYDGVRAIAFNANYGENNCVTELIGYAYAEYMLARALVKFTKTIQGYVDPRDILGQVLPFSEVTYSKPVHISGEPAPDWLDCSAATFTVSAL